ALTITIPAAPTAPRRAGTTPTTPREPPGRIRAIAVTIPIRDRQRRAPIGHSTRRLAHRAIFRAARNITHTPAKALMREAPMSPVPPAGRPRPTAAGRSLSHAGTPQA